MGLDSPQAGRTIATVDGTHIVLGVSTAFSGLIAWWALRRRRGRTGSAALASVAQALGGASEALAAMPGVLAELGQAMACTRLELHGIHAAAAGTPLSTLRSAWAAPGVPDRLADPGQRDRPWHAARTRWLAELAAGRSCVATAATASADERRELAGHGAVAMAPVVVGGRLWGCLACWDRHARGRSPDDCAVLQLAAALIAAAICRDEATQQLCAARAEAASGDRAKREFLANISHEVRTPLNGVLGMSGLLLDTELDARQREYAQVVRSSAENLLALLNDLIDLAKAEGDQRVERTRFDPLRLAEDVVAMLAERANIKGLEIAVHPADDLPRRVIGDPTRLRQVLVNLVGNAIKFTTRGEVVVWVDWNEANDGMLTYEVRDSGIGIDPAVQPGIFATFAQGDGSTTRRFGGTGLGLAICKRQVDVLGGTVSCRSVPGSGSTFIVRVPSPGGTSVSGRSSQVPGAHLGTRVLVIEANEAARQAVAAVCRRIGLLPEAAASCPEALARMSSPGAESPRLVLVSANLPGASDLPALLHAAQSPVPCILLSQLHERPHQSETQRLGFIACLVKPARTARLAEVVSRALSRGQDESSGPQTGSHHQHTLRVLVVEDDAINQRLAKAVLERDGVRVDLAGDGLEALEALSRRRYDAVLLDLLMPVMDGFTCAREIRRLEAEHARQPMPLLAVSALDDPEAKRRCREAGIDDVVRKPFEPRHLRRVLRRLTQSRRAG